MKRLTKVSLLVFGLGLVLGHPAFAATTQTITAKHNFTVVAPTNWPHTLSSQFLFLQDVQLFPNRNLEVTITKQALTDAEQAGFDTSGWKGYTDSLVVEMKALIKSQQVNLKNWSATNTTVNGYQAFKIHFREVQKIGYNDLDFYYVTKNGHVVYSISVGFQNYTSENLTNPDLTTIQRLLGSFKIIADDTKVVTSTAGKYSTRVPVWFTVSSFPRTGIDLNRPRAIDTKLDYDVFIHRIDDRGLIPDSTVAKIRVWQQQGWESIKKNYRAMQIETFSSTTDSNGATLKVTATAWKVYSLPGFTAASYTLRADGAGYHTRKMTVLLRKTATRIYDISAGSFAYADGVKVENPDQHEFETIVQNFRAI